MKHLANFVKDHPVGMLLFAIITGIAGNFLYDELKLEAQNQKPLPDEVVLRSNFIAGAWNDAKGVEIARSALQSFDWTLISDINPTKVQHTHIGSYSLIYPSSEGLVLVIGSINMNEECHPCAPYLSFFEFEKNQSGWRLLHSDIAVVQKGSFGMFPAEWMKVEVLATDKYGVFLRWGYTAQGHNVATSTLYLRTGDKLKEVLDLLTSESSPEGAGWDSHISLIPKTTGLYDIRVTRKGYRGPDDLQLLDASDEGRLVSDEAGRVRTTDEYTYDGRSYSRRPSPSTGQGHDANPPSAVPGEINPQVPLPMSSDAAASLSLALREALDVSDHRIRDITVLKIACEALRQGASGVAEAAAESLSAARSAEMAIIKNAAKAITSPHRPSPNWQSICT